MPRILINNFELTPLGSQVRVNVNYTITQTPTEQRLGIPGRIFFRLMERDGSEKDPQYLSAQIGNEYRRDQKDDDISSAWSVPSGTFTDGTYTHIFNVSMSALRNGADTIFEDWGVESWYVIGECRADILDSVALSDQRAINLV